MPSSLRHSEKANPTAVHVRKHSETHHWTKLQSLVEGTHFLMCSLKYKASSGFQWFNAGLPLKSGLGLPAGFDAIKGELGVVVPSSWKSLKGTCRRALSFLTCVWELTCFCSLSLLPSCLCHLPETLNRVTKPLGAGGSVWLHSCPHVLRVSQQLKTD